MLITMDLEREKDEYEYDVVVVGAGISGATVAERYADIGNKVLIIDKRDHIAGNCYDYDMEGIRVNKYGAHIFHTNYEDVWEYVNRFSKWDAYEHKVVAKLGDKLVPVPVNITTINTIFGLNLDENTAPGWFVLHSGDSGKLQNPQNSEEACIARVGKQLYEMLFKPYTRKQWNKDPSELDPSILERIPVRHTFNDRYFSDKYEALPRYGYTEFVRKMLDHPNITIKLNTDFAKIKDKLIYSKLFYTGPIDLFYASLGLPRLEYRSLRFKYEQIYVDGERFFQSHFVVNYPEADVPWTRIIEYKHIGCRGNHKDSTIIAIEYPSDTGEPYYPVVSQANKELYEQYRIHAAKEKNIYFVGRLASYKYYNMDQAIKAALDLFYSLNNSALKDSVLPA
jgi:UDP-galactopyranose mutase